MAKKVWIDCGCHKGKISRHFMKRHKGYTGYAFEPNPNTVPRLPKGVELIRKAVWLDDGESDFYLFGNDKGSEGCTLLEEKSNAGLDKENPIKVQTIDFCRWFKSTFSKRDKIILKMDIEGAEYKVLEHMIDEGVLGWVNKLYVEFHWRQCRMDREKHKVFANKVREHTKAPGEYYIVNKVK